MWSDVVTPSECMTSTVRFVDFVLVKYYLQIHLYDFMLVYSSMKSLSMNGICLLLVY